MAIQLSLSLSPVDDTLDSLLAGSDDEAEEDAVISQVLDEIGIDIQKKVSKLTTYMYYCVCGGFMLHRSQPKLSMGKDLIFPNVGNVMRNRDTLSTYSTRYTGAQVHVITKIVHVQKIEFTRSHDFYHIRPVRV